MLVLSFWCGSFWFILYFPDLFSFWKLHNFPFLCSWIKPGCVHMPRFYHPFIYWQAHRLVSYTCYCKESNSQHWCAIISVVGCSILSVHDSECKAWPYIFRFLLFRCETFIRVFITIILVPLSRSVKSPHFSIPAFVVLIS